METRDIASEQRLPKLFAGMLVSASGARLDVVAVLVLCISLSCQIAGFVALKRTLQLVCYAGEWSRP